MSGPVTVARSLDQALDALRIGPDARLVAGGTDLMVEVNAGRWQPGTLVSVDRAPELRGWHRDGDEIVLGSGLTYAEMERGELARLVPALAQAARTVGSPQIRNAGTLGGNVVTASPAGDTLPVLTALDAVVQIAGPEGTRISPLREFVRGVKRTDLRAGEVVTAVRVPALRGAQEFLKVGTRNAMVISVVMVAVVVDLDGHTVRVGVGSAAPVPVRAPLAEDYVRPLVDWERARIDDPTGEVAAQFGELVAQATSPIDDHRSTAAYRRRAVAVCGARAVRRAFQEPESP